ncbi:MAG TPA: hypothetical protein VL357_02495 [Rariglobus sp.]|jgi:hypothetical protein|nr:hypothetical protein [Rariglobus sp.]
MRARLLEDWLAKIGERGFEVPFSQVLITHGHKVLRMGHSPIEHGKDIITRDAKRNLHAYQLKQGSVDLKEWERIYPQIVALVETAVDHPNVGRESFQPWLVISGSFSAPVLNRISNHNKEWKRRRLPTLKVIEGKELLTEFSNLASDFWPVELLEIEAFIALYQKPGAAFIDKAGYAKFCLSLIKGGGRVKAELARRLSALNIFVSYLLSRAYATGNHWAVVEGWTVASSHILWAAQKWSLPSKQWEAAFGLAQSAALNALAKLKDEALAEKAMDPGNLEWDEITRARGTYVAGAVSAWFLVQGSKADTVEIRRGHDFVRSLISGQRTLIWGESSIPFYIAMVTFLSSAGGERLDECLLLHLVKMLAVTNGRRSRQGLPDPYEDADTALERLLRRAKKVTPRPRMHTGRAFTLEGLVFLCARRLLKGPLDAHWPAITYVDFVKFIPDELNDFLLWHVVDGSLDSRQPARPQSWAKLLATVRSQDYRRNLPLALLERPGFSLLFSLVFPQRLTSDMVLFLDDSLRRI